MHYARRSLALILLTITSLLSSCLIAATQYGPVRSEETLESIAKSLQTGNQHSTEQWTVALWNSNYEHFEAQNIFGLHSDILLEVPSQDEVSKVSQEMAEATIKEHSEAWQALFNFEEIEELASHGTNQNIAVINRLDPIVEQPYRQAFSLTTSLGYALSHAKSMTDRIMTKQNIPLLIVAIGSILIACIFRIAQLANKNQQLEKNKQLDPQGNNQVQSLCVAENEGDYNIFATPEGVNIKLDLAQAYIHMRDLEGARNILQEIIINHHGRAVVEAKKLLNRLHEPSQLLEHAQTT